MRFKTILQSFSALTIVASLMSSAYAANSGFYIGVDGGRDVGTVKENDNYTDFFNVNMTSPNYTDGLLWGAHAGYNVFLTQNFVLGAEIFWNRSDAYLDWQYNSSSNDRELKINSSVGASLLPGWQIDNNNRLYLRASWIQSHFNQENNDSISYGPTFTNTRSDGLELGLGYLVNFARQWDVRMEYDHIDYHMISRYNVSNSYTYKPRFDRYILGVDYNFGSTQTILPDTLLLPISGWYFAIAGGYDQVSTDAYYSGSNLLYKQNRSLRGNVGELHIGYDWQLGASHAVLGTEIFGATNSSKGNYTQIAGGSLSEYTLREQYSYGASILPGYQLNAANLLYTRIGIIESGFKKTVTGAGLGPNFTTERAGLEVGVGYQVAVDDNWSILGEYDYADYKEIHSSDSTGTYNYDPEENQYKFGVSYHF